MSSAVLHVLATPGGCRASSDRFQPYRLGRGARHRLRRGIRKDLPNLLLHRPAVSGGALPDGGHNRLGDVTDVKGGHPATVALSVAESTGAGGHRAAEGSTSGMQPHLPARATLSRGKATTTARRSSPRRPPSSSPSTPGSGRTATRCAGRRTSPAPDGIRERDTPTEVGSARRTCWRRARSRRRGDPQGSAIRGTGRRRTRCRHEHRCPRAAARGGRPADAGPEGGSRGCGGNQYTAGWWNRSHRPFGWFCPRVHRRSLPPGVNAATSLGDLPNCDQGVD